MPYAVKHLRGKTNVVFVIFILINRKLNSLLYNLVFIIKRSCYDKSFPVNLIFSILLSSVAMKVFPIKCYAVYGISQPIK